VTYYSTVESPIGQLLLTSNGENLTGIHMEKSAHAAEIQPAWQENSSLQVFRKTAQQLSEYFEGNRTDFDLPLSMDGTAFQKLVWRELQKIPYGETTSYKDLAIRIGNPKACRAVGLANGRNPISLVVPCHRVIGANGKLVGYGGGLDRKAQLLELERSVLDA